MTVADQTESLEPLYMTTSGSGGANSTIGAVVVGGDYQGLGIVRSLGLQNIPVCVIDDEHSISRYSRFTTHSITVPDLRDERRTVDIVLETGKRLNLLGWVLYPTREETVAAFARYRSLLTPFFRVPTPQWDTTQWCWDKRKTYSMANELGIPTPQTWYPKTTEELEQITGDPPYAIKPAIKEHFIYATKVKAWRADDRTELRKLFERAVAQVGPGEVMIQELIPGNGTQQFAYCAFFKNRQAIGSMVVRRSRQHPPEFGRASTFVETIDLPILEELSVRFLSAIDYYGLVEMEFKLDHRNGEYKLLDVNGRTWGYHSIGRSAGVDFPYMLFADLMGDPVLPKRAHPGVKWIRLITDVPTTALEILRGRQGWRAYVRSMHRIDVESVFNRNDILPGLMELALFPYLAVKRGF
jgi:predicted ATP-grasp superfamily ATP-dependent carboligase